MLKFFFLATGILLLNATSSHSAETIGFRQIIIDQGAPRSLNVALWYPTNSQSKPESTGENVAFYGISAIKDATPLQRQHPFVLLSHGYSGNWRNLNWLASELVAQGYIVAAPDHPGTTTFNKDAQQAAQTWQRPHDLSRVIDALINDPELAGPIDKQRIAAIGHSLGGWTVAALAGATFNTEQFEKDCQVNTSPRACSLSAELGLQNPTLEKSMADPRLKAFVSLDLGLARGFTSESLASITIPSLIISAGIDIGDMPAELESGYLAQHLPKEHSTYVQIPDAIHFSFMQLCKPGAAALIDAEAPGEGIVCQDDDTRPRQEIHREIAFLVIGFLTTVMSEKL